MLPGGPAVPIIRIELLSSTHKTGRGQDIYLAKRDIALESGTVLVELDYLHETDSLIPGIPSYASREPGAYAYTITLSDPRPTLEAGQLYMFGFSVDDPMPIAFETYAASDQKIIQQRMTAIKQSYGD